MGEFFRIEDLVVYQKLCRLHVEVCELSKSWPWHERFELISQLRRSSNSAPAQLAEKHSYRHLRNKIEGANRARGEALETVHHLYVAMLKQYLTGETYEAIRGRYLECVRMLNGLEKTLERQLPPSEQKWPSPLFPNPEPRTLNADPRPMNPEPRTPNPEPRIPNPEP